MNTLTVTLPKGLKDFIKRQAVAGGFTSVEDYIRTLVADEQKRKARERLEGLVLEGARSGKPLVADSRYWEQKNRKLKSRYSKKTVR